MLSILILLRHVMLSMASRHPNDIYIKFTFIPSISVTNNVATFHANKDN